MGVPKKTTRLVRGEGGKNRPPDFMDFMDGHFIENSKNIFSSYLFLLFWVDKQLGKFGVQSGSQKDFFVPIAHSWPVLAPFYGSNLRKYGDHLGSRL